MSYLPSIKIERYPGTSRSWKTFQRVRELTSIAKDLKQKGDPYKQLKNVVEIIKFWNCDILDWNDMDGKVMYFCQGCPLSDPIKFDWADVRRLNTAEKRRGGGFWVEGASL